MALDPTLAQLLAGLVAAGGKQPPDITVAEARANYLMLTRDTLPLEQVVAVGEVSALTVLGATGPLAARCYRPTQTGPLPTVLYFHGGGWVIGDLDTHDNICRLICRDSEVVVVSVDYRLAPEHPFPAATDDAVAALRWVLTHAADLGGSDRVAVAGDSAGGNLAAVAAQAAVAAGDTLAAQFLIYPATDLLGEGYPSRVDNGSGYFLEENTMQWFLDQYFAAGRPAVDDPRVALQHATLAGQAPALVVTAEYDPLRDEAEAYVQALIAAEVPVVHQRAEGMIHGFFDMGRWSPAARDAVEVACRRFGALVRGG